MHTHTVAANSVVRGPAGLCLDASRVRARRAEEAKAFAQLGQQVEARVFEYPYPGLMAASKLVIL